MTAKQRKKKAKKWRKVLEKRRQEERFTAAYAARRLAGNSEALARQLAFMDVAHDDYARNPPD